MPFTYLIENIKKVHISIVLIQNLFLLATKIQSLLTKSRNQHALEMGTQPQYMTFRAQHIDFL